jgi:hypothetical protein
LLTIQHHNSTLLHPCFTSLPLQHTAGVGAGGHGGVFGKTAFGNIRLAGFPCLLAFFQLGRSQFDIDFPGRDIDFDNIAFFQQTNRTADSRFRTDMADTGAARPAGKRPSVINATDSPKPAPII